MSDPAAPLGLAPSLLERLRATEAKIEWRPVRPPRRGRGGGPVRQIAHLFQEEARVERSDSGTGLDLRVDAGPVGALVVLLEADRRAARPTLASLNPGRDPAFPGGAFVACWGDARAPESDAPLDLRQLAELARYALA